MADYRRKRKPMIKLHRLHRAGCCAAAIFLLSAMGSAQNGAGADLTEQSLEDLMNIKVTSASKTAESLSRTASAIFVISEADIRNSGATNIPDLLRMVPGLDVAQINGNTWAISARGFNGRFANELLVTLDGRNVYSPTSGGVFWDVLDLPLENIERIEVIRGTGGTIWGANAVNGVINIITKKAGETHGGMVVAGGGNVEQGFGTVQYGGAIGGNTDYRVFTKYFNQGQLRSENGTLGDDGWHMLRGGFRTDTVLTPKDTLMTQGDLYGGAENDISPIFPSITLPGQIFVGIRSPLSGGFFQTAWDHVLSPTQNTSLQISYDAYTRDDALMEVRKTFNIDFEHRFAWGARQKFIWGANYRDTDSTTHGDLTVSLNPPDLTMQLFSLFVQDEIAIVPDKLYVTGGIRLDHNYYTGFNIMPSARVAWTPTARQTWWAAISQADRTPTELDTARRINVAGFVGPGGVQTLLALIGNPDFNDEILRDYEIGYRTTLANNISVDMVAYFGHYTHQQTTEPAAPFFESTPPPPHLLIPLTYENLEHGEAYGFEAAVNWKANHRWTLSPGYAFEQIHLHLDPSSKDTTSVFADEGSSPVNSAQLRSHVNLPHGLAWDASAYFVDRLKSGNVPSYTRVDTGLKYGLSEHISLSLVGQNLVKDRHLEFVDDLSTVSSTLVKRSGYAKVTWTF
jgi:iron complex outermembrane receptor protein